MIAAKHSHYPLLGSLIEAIADFLTRSIHRYKAAQELRNIGPGEVSAIARDLGISQTELKLVARRDAGFPTRLKSMLSLLKIDGRALQETNPILMRDMQKVCAFCQNTHRCSRELRAGSAAAHFPDYCQNSANFDAILVKRPPRPALGAE
jgi:hypothetical protein